MRNRLACLASERRPLSIAALAAALRADQLPSLSHGQPQGPSRVHRRGRTTVHVSTRTEARTARIINFVSVTASGHHKAPILQRPDVTVIEHSCDLRGGSFRGSTAGKRLGTIASIVCRLACPIRG